LVILKIILYFATLLFDSITRFILCYRKSRIKKHENQTKSIKNAQKRTTMDKQDQELIASVVAATVKQLVKEQVIPAQKEDKKREKDKADSARKSGRHVYGLKGIEELFHVSHKTAQKYKDSILRPAVRQNGRKIITDADYAMELFSKAGDKNER